MEFSERYEITHRIGSGGVGAVYQATDKSLGRQVAVKRLIARGESEDTGRLGSDLLKEARALSAFQHPNIVTVFDAGRDADGLYIVMELLQGETLDFAVARAPLDFRSFTAIATETLEGLVAAHDRHILHRDLKPSNLYLHRLPSGGIQAKILDFGLAKASATPSLQTVDHTRSILGSIYFLAPEQFERKPLDNRTDLYQFGCMLFYALTGRYAFDGDTTAGVMQAHFDNNPRDLATLRPDLPEPVRTWLLWHLNLSPDNRPSSAKESLTTLQSVLAGNAAPHVTLPGTRPPSASTTKVPLNRPATNSPTPTPTPSTATQAYLAKVAAKTNPTTKTPTPRPKKKSNNNTAVGVATGIWIAVIFLMLVAFSGIAIYALKQNSPDPQTTEIPQLPDPLPEPGSESETKPQAPPETPATPAAIVHLDASKATFTDAAKTPATAGDRVAHWADTSPAGGDNPAQYHVTDHKNPPSRWPILKTGKDGSHSLDFDGRRNLLVGRSGGGDPLAPALGKKSVTLVLRFLARPPKNTADAAERRHLAGLRIGDNKRSLDTFIRDGKLFFGFISSPGRSDLSQRSLPVATGRYTVAFAVADPAFRTILLETWTPDGKNKTSTSAVDAIEPFTKIKELRIGGSGLSTSQPNLFNGEISDVLLYDRPLDGAERRALAKKLNKKPRP